VRVDEPVLTEKPAQAIEVAATERVQAVDAKNMDMLLRATTEFVEIVGIGKRRDRLHRVENVADAELANERLQCLRGAGHATRHDQGQQGDPF